MQAIETTFYSHSTSYYGTVCAIRSKPYGWDLRKKAKISSKDTKKNIFGFFIFPQKLCRRLKRLFSRSTTYYGTMCAIRSKPYRWDLRKKANISSKNTKKKHFWTFYISLKIVQAIETTFHSHSTSC